MTKNYSRANTGIDLNLIPVFIEVVRCGSMAKASVRLEMSRPAVSLALKRFSQVFAEPLFIRKGLYLEPTEKALTLTHHLEILLGNIHDNISAINLSENNTRYRMYRVGEYYATLCVVSLNDDMASISWRDCSSSERVAAEDCCTSAAFCCAVSSI